MEILLDAIDLSSSQEAVAVLLEVVSVKAVKTGWRTDPYFAVLFLVDAVYS